MSQRPPRRPARMRSQSPRRNVSRPHTSRAIKPVVVTPIGATPVVEAPDALLPPPALTIERADPDGVIALAVSAGLVCLVVLLIVFGMSAAS